MKAISEPRGAGQAGAEARSARLQHVTDDPPMEGYDKFGVNDCR